MPSQPSSIGVSTYWFETPRFSQPIADFQPIVGDSDGPTHNVTFGNKPKEDLEDRLNTWMATNTGLPQTYVELETPHGRMHHVRAYTHFDGKSLSGVYAWTNQFHEGSGLFTPKRPREYQHGACIRVQPTGPIPEELKSLLEECGYKQI